MLIFLEIFTFLMFVEQIIVMWISGSKLVKDGTITEPVLIVSCVISVILEFALSAFLASLVCLGISLR